MSLYDIPCMYFFVLCSSASPLPSLRPLLLVLSSPTNSLSLCSHGASYILSHPLLLLLPLHDLLLPRFIFYFRDIHTLTLMGTLKHVSARRLIQGTTMYLLFCRTVTSPLVLLHSSACHCSC